MYFRRRIDEHRLHHQGEDDLGVNPYHTICQRSNSTNSTNTAIDVFRNAMNPKRKVAKSITPVSTVMIYTLTLLLLMMLPLSTNAQQQICSCSPPTYYWQLDFSRAGCPLSVTGQGGTAGTPFCDLSSVSPNFNGDFKPVAITDFLFIELDTQLSGIKILELTDTRLENGDTIEFESVTSVSQGQISGGLQGAFVAVNQAGQKFTLDFLLRFSNACERLPFNAGDSLGYLVFVSTYIVSSLSYMMQF